jgi:hypothetical protein
VVRLEWGKANGLPISQGGGQKAADRRWAGGPSGGMVGKTSRPVACCQWENQKVKQRCGWVGKGKKGVADSNTQEERWWWGIQR